MARSEGTLTEFEHLAILAGGVGLAYWGWKQGWFSQFFAASPAPAALASTDTVGSQLLPPTQPLVSAPTDDSGNPIVTYLPAPYSPPTQTYVVAQSSPAPASSSAPVAYNADGSPYYPSNFNVQYNPNTGLELPYAPPGALVPAQNLCNSIFPDNDPTGIYETNPGDNKVYANMIDALADDFDWLKQYFPGVTTLAQIADGRTGGAGYNGAASATMANLMSQLLGLPTTAPIDMSVPKNMVAVLRGFVASHRGQSFFNTVPDQCFIAAYNQVFSPPITSL